MDTKTREYKPQMNPAVPQRLEGSPDFARSSETRGGYVWQAALVRFIQPRLILPSNECNQNR
jgi:hypothetical protein